MGVDIDGRCETSDVDSPRQINGLTYLLVKYWLSDVKIIGNMAILDNMPA